MAIERQTSVYITYGRPFGHQLKDLGTMKIKDCLEQKECIKCPYNKKGRCPALKAWEKEHKPTRSTC